MGMTFTLHEDLKYPFGVGSHNEQLIYLVPDTSYPTGGYVYASSTVNGLTLGLSLRTIMAIIPIGGDTSAIGYELYQNFETQKVMILQTAGFTPAGTIAAHSHTLNFKNAAVADGATTRVNAGTNLLGANTGSDIAVAGAGANGGIANTTTVFTGTAVSAGPAVEVPNATDLSALRFLVRIVGR